MMFRAEKVLTLVLAITAAVLFTGCEIDSPIKELTAAKSAITLARTYKADVYAKELLAEAEKGLYDAHSLIKDEKNTEAQQKAIASKQKADEALAKALPLLAQATIDQANTDITNARDYYSDEFAPDQMKKADDLIAQATADNSAKSYIPAYNEALGASASAKEALDKTFAQIPSVQSKIADMENARNYLLTKKADKYAPDDMKDLNDKIADAKAQIAVKKVKDALYSLSAAQEIVDRANLTVSTAVEIQKKIDKADEGLANVTKSQYAPQVTSGIDAAKAKIADAKSSFSGQNYSDASTKADEALAMIDMLVLQLERCDLQAKADAMAKANAQVAVVAQKKDEKKTETAVKVAEEKIREYVVQWHKVNTDCLWRIADKMYKNPKLWPLIFMANRSQIKDPDLIYPGQKFKIPPVPEKPAKKEPVKKDDAAAKPADSANDATAKDAATTDAAKPSDQTPSDTTAPATAK